MYKRILHIIIKDIRLDIRGKFGFLASLLYLLTIVFVIFKLIGDVSLVMKMALFWIIILFTAINFMSQSYGNHLRKRKIYYYQVYSPTELILAKIILNLIKLLITGSILVLIQSLLSGSMVKDPVLFVSGFILASIGIVAVLTLVASISIYGHEQNGLMTILALPLLLPVLLLSMRISLVSERMFVDSKVSNYLLMLSGIDILLITLLIIFFPIVWKS